MNINKSKTNKPVSKLKISNPLSYLDFPNITFQNLFTGTDSKSDIIVFSHLRWQFVTQRPQHLLTRLAKKHRILFIEEPIAYNDSNLGTFNVIKPHKNITILQPRIPTLNQTGLLYDLISEYLNKYNYRSYITWFYSPQFIDLLPLLKSRLVIYDCMDELSAFKFAPSDLRDNEKKLLKVADLVFTGGRSLYHSKIKQADSVYCYPSSVEVKHFQKARTSHFKRPSDLVKISKPIVGFYGVVDERIDLDLIAYTATCLPNVSFVVIGPVVKIDVNTLPQNHNIHYLGPKAYETLPRYLKYFDAAMMPFALNIHTKYISPTKTLEFLASGTPTISTPIKDVVTDYSSIVAIAYNRNEFVTAISNTLNLDTKFYYDWLKQVDKVISKTSWDRTVKSMEKNINQTLQTKVLQEASLSRLIKTNLASHLGVIYEASS